MNAENPAPPELDDNILEEAYATNGRFDEAQELLAGYDVADLAAEQTSGHGREMSIALAIASCPHFADSVRGFAGAAHSMGVKDPAMIAAGLRTHISGLMQEAPQSVNQTEAEKK